MKRFQYFNPSSIVDAELLLDTYGEKAKVLAGGTDLIVQIKNNEIDPTILIDLKKIPELTGIDSTNNNGYIIYPLTTISEIESSKSIKNHYPILSESAKTIGSIQIRNRATIGGNLCRAAPSADMVPALLVLEAQLKIRKLNNEKTIPLEEYFVGSGKTVLKKNEILAEIIIPNNLSKNIGVYIKNGPRQTMDLATVGVAVFAAIDPSNSTCNSIKIGIASVAPTPFRARKAEKILMGNKMTPLLIKEVAKVASYEAKPITDVYGPDWYKREMVEVLVKQAIMEALTRTRKGRSETED